MRGSGRGAAVTLAEGKRRFERWRQSSRRGRHIPEELWSLAVGLASEHGVSKTASTLRLEYYALKRQLEKIATLRRCRTRASVWYALQQSA
jgi:hypothetical protein